MPNPPFQPPTFSGTIPATKPGGGWNTYTGPQEDGPGAFVDKNGQPIRYNGQDQTFYINTGRAPLGPADWEAGPNVIDKAGNIGLIVSTPTAKAGSQGAVPGPVQEPRSGPALRVYLGTDGKIYGYDPANGISYPLT